MSSWAEAILAFVVLLGLGVALLLFTGESLGGESISDTTQVISVDQEAAARGRTVSESAGCLLCHTVDGTPSSGPTWRGLAGSSRPLASGETVTANDAYLFASIVDPATQLVAGFDPIMPPDYGDTLTESEVEDIVEYIKSLAS